MNVTKEKEENWKTRMNQTLSTNEKWSLKVSLSEWKCRGLNCLLKREVLLRPGWRRVGITVICKLHICEEPTSAASMGVGHGQRKEVREAVGRNTKTSPSLRPSI